MRQSLHQKTTLGKTENPFKIRIYSKQLKTPSRYEFIQKKLKTPSRYDKDAQTQVFLNIDRFLSKFLKKHVQ